MENTPSLPVGTEDSQSREKEPWGLLAVVSTNAFLLIGGMLASLAVYISYMQDHFGWSEAAMGGGPVALLLGMSIGNLLVSTALRWLGLRHTFVVGVLVAVASWIAAGFSHALLQFILVMFVAGTGVGVATIVPGITFLSDSFSERKGLAIAIFIGACTLAASILPMTTEALVARFGWRSTFWIVGSVSGVISLSLLQRLPRRLETSFSSQAAEVASSLEDSLSRKQALHLPEFWLLALALTLSQIGVNGVMFNVIAYLEKSGFAMDTSVQIYSAANFMSLPGLLVGGFISDLIGGRRLLPAILGLQAIGTAMLLGAGSASFSLPGIVGFILVWGGVSGLPAQSGSLFLGEAIGQKSYSFMLGILFALTNTIGASAPFIMGWAHDMTGSYFWPILLLFLCILIGMFAILLGRASPAPFSVGHEARKPPGR